jgi:hypothetical protein
MTEIRTLLLIDDDSHHADVFIDALLSAIDGPFKGEWVTTLWEGIERLKKRSRLGLYFAKTAPNPDEGYERKKPRPLTRPTVCEIIRQLHLERVF